MLVHIFQIIPIILFISSHSSNYLFEIPSGFPELLVLTVVSSLSFLTSFQLDKNWGRWSFVGSFSLLYIFLINKLYLSPSLGILLTSLYIIILFKLRAYRITHAFPTSYSILLPYVISLILYSLHKFNMSQNLPIFLLAINLSFASLIYLIGMRSRFFKSFQFISIILILLSAILFLNDSRILLLSKFTDIWFITVSLLSMIVLYKDKRVGMDSVLQFLFRVPEATIISYFCILSVCGTFLLELRASRVPEAAFSVIDNLFTAVSAVCVTGLIIMDTPNDFSFFGQSVILLLIQLGGFGIVAISSWVLVGMQSKRLSILHEQTLSEMSGHRPLLTGMKSTLRQIILYFIVFEVSGTVLLFWRFLQHDTSPGVALWRALFTAVSAFCNAGFALQTDNLIPYQEDLWILIVVSLLIIAGGFAPVMAIHLPKKLLKGKLTLQEKLVLSTTLGLLLFGFLFFTLVEWNHSLQHLGFFDKIGNAWFQSVTTRTAGFNSLDFSKLQDITPFFFMFLMFIGGNPGGTAGGIKTITFATILLAGFSGIRGEDHIRIFNRKITAKGVYKTLAIFSVGLCTLFVFFFMLVITQDISIVSILFETVSALGTVGLSLGITARLDDVGKVLVILCMILGRVGPLAFILLLFRNKQKRNWSVPEEDIYIS